MFVEVIAVGGLVSAAVLFIVSIGGIIKWVSSLFEGRKRETVSPNPE